MPKNRKKNIIRMALAGGTLVSLFFVPWILVKAWIMPLPATIQEQAEEAIGYGFEGMIVYVDKAGEDPGFYAAGWHDRDQKIPANPHALFKIASIGKLYDAVAITKLVHENRLSLDKTLADYFPELVGRIENAGEITVRMLVQHRSGIPNFTNTPGFWINPPKNSKETLDLVLDLPANFKPGVDFEYSNTNYLLLNLLIEKVTGAGKIEYMRERIFDPLHLDNTYGSIHEVDLRDVMSGYYVGVGEDIKTTDYKSMLATAEDVGTFVRALNDGTLFEGDEAKTYSSIYVYDHTGLIPGYQSIAKYHKDLDVVVVQFLNTTNFDGYEWNLSEIFYNRIVKILRNKNPG